MLTKSDLTQIRNIVQEETNQIVKKELKPVKKSIKKLQKTLDDTIGHFDLEDTKIIKRVKRIEDHLGFPQ